jgi:hypothetical protein
VEGGVGVTAARPDTGSTAIPSNNARRLVLNASFMAFPAMTCQLQHKAALLNKLYLGLSLIDNEKP